MYQNKYSYDIIMHNGVLGQKWGVRNGPPYPLNRNNDKLHRHARFRMPEMSTEDYIFANKLWEQNTEYNPIFNSKTRIYSAMTNNLSAEEKTQPIVDQIVGDYIYTAINKGYEQYKILTEERIEKPAGRPIDLEDEIFSNIFGWEWKKYEK